MLLGPPTPGSPAIAVPRSVAAALVAGVVLSLLLGLTVAPMLELFQTAATMLGGTR
jgi:hydrogenase-4 component F